MKNNNKPATNKNNPKSMTPPAAAVNNMAVTASFRGAELHPSHHAAAKINAPKRMEPAPVREYCMVGLTAPLF